MKQQIDATLCMFYFCRVNIHVSGVKRPSSGVFKTSTAATGTCVIVAGKSSHLLIRVGTRRVTLHVSGASAHHQEYLKLVQRPLVHVLSLQVIHHISILGPNMEMW